MNIFDILTLLGGLSLFLFGMNIMGQTLERRAGGKLHSFLEKMTTGKLTGLLTGLGITAVIQSSSATTVMVVGFVNSGIMSLKQAINVIMGANVGTTITAWILSLAGIDSTNFVVKMLKPSSFVPVLALIGVIFYIFRKDEKEKDTGLILLGFATLMFGMETMSGAVAGLKNVPEFTRLFVAFQNPILGVLAGALLTAIIQSSSASVGILQALSSTGQVSYGAAIPIIMGQNIGTCITAMLSSIGANKNARRAAMVHLNFNAIGTAICLLIYCFVSSVFSPTVLGQPASLFGIAVIHSVFNVICTLILFPASDILEKIVYRIIPEDVKDEENEELDERLLSTPFIALKQCHEMVIRMARCAVDALHGSLDLFEEYSTGLVEEIRKQEELCDHYEDIIGTYLVKLSEQQISADDSKEAAKYLRYIGDLERISDYAVSLANSVNELKEKGITLSQSAVSELSVLRSAVQEISNLSLKTVTDNDLSEAVLIEPLEEVIDHLKEQMRSNHIQRLQKKECGIEAGFVWSDILTSLDRVAAHCSNIAGCIIDLSLKGAAVHRSLKISKEFSESYIENYEYYDKRYALKGE